MVWPGVRPSEMPASRWPRSMASMPARKISDSTAPPCNPRPMAAAVKESRLSAGMESGKAK